MADTRRDWTIRPSLPGPEKPAGSVCSLPRRSICVCSAPQRFFLHTYPRTRSSRSASVRCRTNRRTRVERCVARTQHAFPTIPQRNNPCRHLTRRGGHPFLKHFKLFFLSPLPLQCVAESNDPRLSRKGFRNGVVWLPLRDFLLFFFFLFSFIRFSAERDGEFSRLTFSFSFFLSVETSTKIM